MKKMKYFKLITILFLIMIVKEDAKITPPYTIIISKKWGSIAEAIASASSISTITIFPENPLGNAGCEYRIFLNSSKPDYRLEK